MAKNPLIGLLIRSAAVRLPDVGYILACDPKLAENDVPHTISFSWKSGVFKRGDAKFSANSCCIVWEPEGGWIKTGGEGFYSAVMQSGITVGNIFRNSSPPRKEVRYGAISSTAEIAGKAYAIGLRGTAFRLDSPSEWTRIDEGLPASFNGEAVHGFDASDIYAVGRKGELWHFDGRKWSKRELPVNANLTEVKCAQNGLVYITGHKGTLIRGIDDSWEQLETHIESDDLWDIEWFEGSLYVSSLSGVFRLDGNELRPVDFGKHTPQTTYRLSAASGVLWSIGRSDIVSFDGKSWVRIV